MSATTLTRNLKTPSIGPGSPVERIAVDRYNAMIAEVQALPPKQLELPEVLQRLVG